VSIAEIDPRMRDAYTHFDTEKLRFSDTDMIGHVNNVAFAALFESGRTAFSHAHLYPHVPRGHLVVMARVEIDYRRELHWPGMVDIGTRIASVGGKSYALTQGMFRDELCIATSRTTLVLIDRHTRRATTLPDDYRNVLQSLT
jgi:acyl-CoA thioester hydrolase